MSCGAKSSQNQQSKNDDDNWVMTNHTFTTNTYTQTGLLDTSYKAMVVYEMGMTMDTIKSIVLRKYNGNKLTNEREFTIEKDGSKTLSNETIKQYDAKGNLTTEIDMMDSNVLSKKINNYNGKQQVIKSVNIFRKMNDNPNDYILDSAVAHRNDKKHFEYDTTIISNEYNTNGNIVRTIESDSKGAIQTTSITQYNVNGNPIHTTVFDKRGIVQETSITQYSGKDITFSCDLNSQGDTIATFVSIHEGNLIKQIANIKELNRVDTIWLDKDKVVKLIGHQGKLKSKDETTYNDKGDEVESVSYK